MLRFISTGLFFFLVVSNGQAQSKCLGDSDITEEKFNGITAEYTSAYRFDDSTLDMVFKGRYDELFNS